MYASQTWVQTISAANRAAKPLPLKAVPARTHLPLHQYCAYWQCSWRALAQYLSVGGETPDDMWQAECLTINCNGNVFASFFRRDFSGKKRIERVRIGICHTRNGKRYVRPLPQLIVKGC